MPRRKTPKKDSTPSSGAGALRPRPEVPTVAVGASAGGLEAVEQLLRFIPNGSGVAVVVVQHLDPVHKGMMAELLQRSTAMLVRQVKDRTRVEPNAVYVIPPNKDMSILHGVLHLLEPVAPRGRRLPIDSFFRSVADDKRRQSVGVVLSGMGSDGTEGLKAIKAAGGATFVQEPSSAKFDAMPRSAIDAGVADVIAPPDELGARILAAIAHPGRVAAPASPLSVQARSSIDKIFIILRGQTGHDFGAYKHSSVLRRVERRMAAHKIANIADYARYLQLNPPEVELLFKEMLIGVTSFFRDPVAWDALADRAIPLLLTTRPADVPIRVWVPGCSTGEEAYSIAILLREAMVELQPPARLPVQIFATDLNKDAIDRARQGAYPHSIAREVSPERLRRFFAPQGDGYVVNKEIRESVVFATQNVVMDPPFTQLDLLSCRNLLIYLSTPQQRRLIRLFHYSLRAGGVLFLGNAETIGAVSGLFSALEAKTRLFRRLDTGNAVPVDFPSTLLPGRPRAADSGGVEQPLTQSAASLQALADSVILKRFGPPTVLTNDKGDVLYVSGRTGKYLEPAAGKANWNIYAMAREDLRYELGAAFRRVVREGKPEMLRSIRVVTDAGVTRVDVSIEPILQPTALRGMIMTSFLQVPQRASRPARRRPDAGNDQASSAAAAEEELQRARVDIQTMREEMQASQEELTSANEELQSANEELQSTNEELTTSKEELQSLNEEMQTLNQELQAKVEDLSRANNDMRNLLDSTDIATLFLDSRLHVRRFTSRMAKLVKLIPGDIGRPITDLASDLLYPEFETDVAEVLKTRSFRERTVATSDGRWFTVRVMPYYTLDNRVDGVVITFVDVTVAKRLEAALRATGTGPGEEP